VPLLKCARCKSVSYCNKDCQKTHWKTHKQSCARGGSQPQPDTRTDDKFLPTGEQDKKPFTAISKNTFLHNRSHEQTFQLLIDMLRMRQADEYKFDGKAMPGTIYNQEPSSEKAFRELIRKAKAIPGLLPPWWDDKSLGQCLEYSCKSSAFSLRCAQEKHDVQETWGDDRMPMKLRMVAERVYGYTPGGSKSDQLLAVMIGAESGDSADTCTFHTQLNLNA
jgi:splicing suppressor protein 51